MAITGYNKTIQSTMVNVYRNERTKASIGFDGYNLVWFIDDTYVDSITKRAIPAQNLQQWDDDTTYDAGDTFVSYANLNVNDELWNTSYIYRCVVKTTKGESPYTAQAKWIRQGPSNSFIGQIKIEDIQDLQGELDKLWSHVFEKAKINVYKDDDLIIQANVIVDVFELDNASDKTFTSFVAWNDSASSILKFQLKKKMNSGNYVTASSDFTFGLPSIPENGADYECLIPAAINNGAVDLDNSFLIVNTNTVTGGIDSQLSWNAVNPQWYFTSTQDRATIFDNPTLAYSNIENTSGKIKLIQDSSNFITNSIDSTPAKFIYFVVNKPIIIKDENGNIFTVIDSDSEGDSYFRSKETTIKSKNGQFDMDVIVYYTREQKQFTDVKFYITEA